MGQNGSLTLKEQIHQLKGELVMERMGNLALQMKIDKIWAELQKVKDAVDLMQIERDRAEVARW